MTRNPIFVLSDTLAVEALQKMVQGKFRHLPVVENGEVMTPNPECATVDTPIVDALHTMHDGKFLHIPVLDRDGAVVAVVDVIHITHVAVATVGNTAAASNEAATNMMQ
ncbi:CBS domain-containing protein CBSCBSPB5-like [Malus sylvestris]|uniref:CBS domain-containing protein CBSCBSPB5-like n=1 Tax=Malus sylvestris TaxID=3752 RepID=UPI0021ABC022|nr:CBS domain-containing protein CBSCBSPB5-like [Malus sylvestris]